MILRKLYTYSNQIKPLARISLVHDYTKKVQSNSFLFWEDYSTFLFLFERFLHPGKRSNVTPIHKKDSKSNPSNYRPISLLNYTWKIMERCVHKHLSQYLNDHSIITPFQSGFQAGDSTVNQLLYLLTKYLMHFITIKRCAYFFLI